MSRNLRCLIIERHHYETGANQAQIQFVLRTARAFFGRNKRNLILNVFTNHNSTTPAFSTRCSISVEYNNGTRRLNGFNHIPPNNTCFIFIQETRTPNTYDIWWSYDKAIIAAKYDNWSQGGDSQYGRGRLSKIVNEIVNKNISRV